MIARFLLPALIGLLVAGPGSGQDAPKHPAPAGDMPAPAPRVELVTSLGRLVLELDRTKAPLTVENFLGYVEDGFYDGTIFHRVIAGFMIQGGGFELKDGQAVQKPAKPPIKNEGRNGLKNKRGSIAMARTGRPDSATSQFFINVVDNEALDFPRPDGHGYAVFGRVTEGLEVVDKIKAVRTGMKKLKVLHPSGQHLERETPDVPQKDVVIKTARILPPPGSKDR